MVPEPTPRQSGLAEALAHVARHHGLPASAADLLRGLGADPAGLTLAALPEAADRIGMRARIDPLPLSRIPLVTLPVILLDSHGEALVLHHVDRAAGRATVAVPSVDPARHDISLEELEQSFGGIVVFLSPAENARLDGQAERQRGHWFWSAVKRLWPNYLQVVVAALIGNLLGLASPIFVMNVYDRVIPNLAIPTLWVLTAGVALALGFDFLLKLLRMRIVDETGRRVDMAVAGRIFDHVMTMKLAGVPGTTGATANQIRDFDTVRDALTSSSVIAITDLLFIGIFLWVMSILVGPLAWVPAIAVPVVIFVTALLQIPLSSALRASQADSARRQSLLVEALSALETIKTVGGESWLRRAWDRAVAASTRSSTRARSWANLATSFTALVQQAVSICIVVWGVFLVLEGSITVGALIAANILAGRVLAPLANIAQTLARLHQARTALSSLEALMALDTEGHAAAGDIAAKPDAPALQLDNVTLTYPQAVLPSLQAVSFSARAGERIGIIGRVGSGKSTLGRLIGGLHEATEGACLINGVDSRQMPTATLRREVGLCLQETQLVSGTLRDNLLIGHPFAPEAAIERALRLSGTDVFAMQHPLGLSMPISEGGRNLSGGQRQAVALARCLIRDPRILYLDEPTSGMDISTERRLCASLREIAATGITLLIATHRDGPLELVDRLLVFDRGRLMMDGPKGEILARLQAGPPAPPAGGAS